jgi:hypothetical protein
MDFYTRLRKYTTFELTGPSETSFHDEKLTQNLVPGLLEYCKIQIVEHRAHISSSFDFIIEKVFTRFSPTSRSNTTSPRMWIGIISYQIVIGERHLPCSMRKLGCCCPVRETAIAERVIRLFRAIVRWYHSNMVSNQMRPNEWYNGYFSRRFVSNRPGHSLQTGSQTFVDPIVAPKQTASLPRSQCDRMSTNSIQRDRIRKCSKQCINANHGLHITLQTLFDDREFYQNLQFRTFKFMADQRRVLELGFRQGSLLLLEL